MARIAITPPRLKRIDWMCAPPRGLRCPYLFLVMARGRILRAAWQALGPERMAFVPNPRLAILPFFQRLAYRMRMSDNSTQEPSSPKAAAAIAAPMGLFTFIILYGGMTVLAGVVAFKQVQLWPSTLAVEAGIFPFLFLVVITSTIAQLYGQKLANRLIWIGFIPLAISAALIFLVLSLPASREMLEFRAGDLTAFETVLGQTPRILMAGPAAYITSLLLNVWIFSKLRGSGEATTFGLMVRGAIASALSQAVDSIIFVTLAFYGEFDITNLMIGQVLAKVTLSFVLVPFLITFGVRLAQWLDGRGDAAA